MHVSEKDTSEFKHIDDGTGIQVEGFLGLGRHIECSR